MNGTENIWRVIFPELDGSHPPRRGDVCYDGGMENNEAEFSQAELVAIYRMLNPNAVYYGDTPEKWSCAILRHQIRITVDIVR